MITKRINCFTNFEALLEVVLAFDQNEKTDGVIQCILLDGGRVMTACLTHKRPDIMVARDGPKNEKLVEQRLRDLLAFGESGEFVIQMGGMTPIRWQVSD